MSVLLEGPWLLAPGVRTRGNEIAQTNRAEYNRRHRCLLPVTFCYLLPLLVATLFVVDVEPACVAGHKLEAVPPIVPVSHGYNHHNRLYARMDLSLHNTSLCMCR